MDRRDDEHVIQFSIIIIFFFLLLVLKSQQKHKTEANNLDDKPRQSDELSVKPGRSGKHGRTTEISAGKWFAHYLNRTQLEGLTHNVAE